MKNDASVHKTSTGHKFSTSAWLDLHFEAARPEYESTIQLVGMKRGWHVLDAGCGNGRFIDLIEKQIGANGRIHALDLAPENIEIVKKRVARSTFSSRVTAHVGNVTSLPFADHMFDAVWCSAVTQYLTEKQLELTLNEFKRVTKPGGVVAIKEYDGISSYYYPTPGLTLLWRSIDVMDMFDRQRWFVHPIEMHALLKKAGYTGVTQKTILIERRQPLGKAEARYIKGLIRAGEICWSKIEVLSKQDQNKWKALLSETSNEFILKQPNLYWREGHIIAIGKV